jgi:monothiol glutaredoxin
MFIKGTLDAPKCKFTRRLVESLAPFRYRNIKTFNILEDERIRQWLKFYSNWPTFPQVYCDGQFVGGIDVVTELIEGGEFNDVIPAKC